MVAPVKKPWPLYFMALWSFFGIGSFLSAASRSIFAQNEQLLQIVSLGALGVAIALVYLLVKFNKKALIVFAVLAFSLAIFQVFNIVTVLITQGYSPLVLFLLYYIVPSVILAPLAVSKKYRELSSQYAVFQQQENMRKASLKAMGH